MIEIIKNEKSFEEKVHEYFTTNEIKKKSDKVVKALGPDIKDEVVRGDEIEVEYNDGEEFYTYNVKHQKKESVSVNPAKLEAKLEELGFEECFTTIRIVDEDKVSKMIADGVISADVLAECTDTKITGALYVKKVS